MENIVLIGYAGHAYVVADILQKQNCNIVGYMDVSEKASNPFNLKYLGIEDGNTSSSVLLSNKFVIAIGNNLIRSTIFNKLNNQEFISFNAIHPKSVIGNNVKMGNGVTIMAGAILNPMVQVGNGVIINTNAVVEHECVIGNFAHIAPGVVLAGNVTIGDNSFIGANTVIKQGIIIGKNVIIGAGSVILKDIGDGYTAYGNPAKIKLT